MKTDLLLMPMSARYRDMRAAAVAAEEAGIRRALDVGSPARSGRRERPRRAGGVDGPDGASRSDAADLARTARAERGQSPPRRAGQHGRDPPGGLRRPTAPRDRRRWQSEDAL